MDEKERRRTYKTNFVALFLQLERLLYVERVRVYDCFGAMVDVEARVDFFGTGSV